MRRYFYEASPLIRKWLENQYNLTRKEDQIFRSAILSAIRLANKNKQSINLPNLHETILEMTIPEQSKYANNNHLELLFNHFSVLHTHSQGRNMLMRGGFSDIKDLVDPDKFPIWDVHRKTNILYPKWNFVMGKIRFDLGFQLFMQESLVEHPDGGKGVFVRLSNNKKKIQTGELLGFVPGLVYHDLQFYQKLKLSKLNAYEKVPQHLHFPSGKILEFSHLKVKEKDENSDEIDPTYKNPYGMGHMINHPPVGKAPNVCFAEMQIPMKFFPSHYRKFLPYNTFFPIPILKSSQSLTIFGIFALKQIENEEELYVNYLQSHIYPIKEIPQWLIEPKEVNEYYSKKQYELPPSQYWQYLDKLALKRKQFDEYLNKVKRKPGNTVYEDEKIKIRSAKREDCD